MGARFARAGVTLCYMKVRREEVESARQDALNGSFYHALKNKFPEDMVSFWVRSPQVG